MRELERSGGSSGIDELRETVRWRMSYGVETKKAWDKEFRNLFGWTMHMLLGLKEVDVWPPSAEFTSGYYEALPRDPNKSERDLVRRRQQWVDDWWQAERDRQA